MKPYVLLFVFLYGCAGARDVTGIYWSDKSPCKLTLNNDSVFTFEYTFQFKYEHATGTWHKAGKNKYILNSFVKNRKLSINVSEVAGNVGSADNLVSTRIRIPDQTYYKCGIFVDDALYETRSCDSLSSIVITKPLRSIYFGFSADERMPGRFLDTLYTQTFHPRMEYSNNLNVEIAYVDSFFNYRIFDSELIHIANKKLMFYEKPGVKTLLSKHSRNSNN